VIPPTSVNRPQLKSNQKEDRVMLNNSQGKKQEVEDHRRNAKFSNNKTFVTALPLYPFTERYAQPYFFSCLIRQLSLLYVKNRGVTDWYQSHGYGEQASPGNISPDPPDNLSKYLFASLAISPFYTPILPQDPITPPTIFTPSPVLPPSPLFDP
nr:hypothetical protein [Tanacetum cinerariifolium]